MRDCGSSCAEAVNALADYFDVITVDGRRLRGERLRGLLAAVNERKVELRVLRSAVSGRRRRLA